MKMSSRRREDPDLNLTSLIDVVFLLLIFFMVSTSFDKNSEIKITLPEAAIDNPLTEKDEPIEVTVSADGNFFINGQRVVNTQISTLKQALVKIGNGRKDPPVVINADALATHQAVVTVMDAARQVGFVHINIATTKSAGAEAKAE